MTIFSCAQCQTIVSKPLTHLDELNLLQDNVGEDCYNPPALVPEGSYILSNEVLAAGKMWEATEEYAAFAPLQEFVFNSSDLIKHPNMFNEKDIGCCGYGGADGYNVFCTNGHAIGTEISDCCVVNYVHVPVHNVQKRTIPN